MSTQPEPHERVGVVVIGRNEGERLKACLRSVLRTSSRVVYVDSESTDGSVAFAESLGVEVLALDLSVPFTAARARHEGYMRLVERYADVAYVQFFDGDCEVFEGWLEAGAETLAARPEVDIVTGFRRERYPRETAYNMMIAAEWDRPVGVIEACGGDMMVRRGAYERVGGFNPRVIAAEDDELCVRVRETGGTILRLDRDMTLHDAALKRFGQWWKRAKRAGHGYAQVGDMHPGYFAKPQRSAWFWGLALPAASVGLAPVTLGTSLGLLGLYPAQVRRTQRNLEAEGMDPQDARVYAFFLTLGKLPEVLGMLTYWRRQALGQAMEIIEYKGPGT